MYKLLNEVPKDVVDYNIDEAYRRYDQALVKWINNPNSLDKDKPLPPPTCGWSDYQIDIDSTIKDDICMYCLGAKIMHLMRENKKSFDEWLLNFINKTKKQHIADMVVFKSSFINNKKSFYEILDENDIPWSVHPCQPHPCNLYQYNGSVLRDLYSADASYKSYKLVHWFTNEKGYYHSESVDITMIDMLYGQEAFEAFEW